MLHDFKPADDGLDKDQRKAEIRRLRERLAAQQQSVMAAKLPVVVLVEGWDCAGKGHLINELISEMDPRFYRVAVYKRVPENEERYPFLRKFFEPLPENGKFLFMDTGWNGVSKPALSVDVGDHNGRFHGTNSSLID